MSSCSQSLETEAAPSLMRIRKCEINNVRDLWKFGITKLFVSTLYYEPKVEDNGSSFTCSFYYGVKELEKKHTPTINILAVPEISDIRELPASEEDEVKFAVDIERFYPDNIQVQCYHNGNFQPQQQANRAVNEDGTHSATIEMVIPEGELKAGDKIEMMVEHESMEAALTKEMTAKDPAGRRMYTVSDISAPEPITSKEKVTLTCCLGGYLARGLKSKWVMRNPSRGELELLEGCSNLQKREYEVSGKLAERRGDGCPNLLVSSLSFTATRADDRSELSCLFFHESTSAPLAVQSATYKLLVKPKVSEIKELPMTGENVVRFAVDVDDFDPHVTEIKWCLNAEEKCNSPALFIYENEAHSNVIVIPEQEVRSRDKITAIIRHKSDNKPEIRDITTEDPAVRRMYNVSDISMSEFFNMSKEVTLSCCLGGILPKDMRTKWVKKRADGREIEMLPNIESLVSKHKVQNILHNGKENESVDLLVSNLTFMPTTDDQNAIITCEFIHETTGKSQRSQPLTFKLWDQENTMPCLEFPASKSQGQAPLNSPSNNDISVFHLFK
uniref:Ig-like domain-containing protein n=2 Tax=Latimeria chalumnae TaxID=7897 RepID=M3XKE9_LATCH